MSPLVALVLFTLFVITFGAFVVSLISFLGPKVEKSDVHTMAYECGFNVPDSEVSKVPIKFYLTAILFIIFDIEIIFMFPWAIAYGEYISQGKGLYIFLSMMVFIAVFVFGLLWEIKSNALEWE